MESIRFQWPAPATAAVPRPPRHRRLDRPAVERPLLKYVILSGGALDKKVVRIPRDYFGVDFTAYNASYRDRGGALDGYPRFDLVTD